MVEKRLREEFAKIQVTVNEEKTRTVDLMKGETFTFSAFVGGGSSGEAASGGHSTNLSRRRERS